MLDLEFRPKLFRDVLGNKGAVSVLLARSRAGTLTGRSLMFRGPKGCGKTSLARIVTRAASCASPDDGEPCNECESCITLLNDSSQSVHEFDAASHGSVERIRSIVDGLDYSTLGGAPSILILDEAHRLSPAAQDAMLRAMEDRRLVVILCTTEPNKIRPALRDRVDEFAIRPPDAADIEARMVKICEVKQIGCEAGALREIVNACGCAPRSCLNALHFISGCGPVTVQAVRDHFRHAQVESVVDALTKLEDDPGAALSALNDVFATESPAWVRDTVVTLTASAYRCMLGLPAKHRVSFVKSGSRINWTQMAKDLAHLERPSVSEIEVILLGSANIYVMGEPRSMTVAPVVAQVSVPQVAPPEPVSATVSAPATVRAPQPPTPHVSTDRLSTDKPTPKPVVKPPSRSAKSMEIDGVRFNADEKNVAIHDKIEPGRGPQAPDTNVVAAVEFDRTRVPISESEFARLFTERVGR